MTIKSSNMRLCNLLKFIMPGTCDPKPKDLTAFIASTSKISRHTAYLMRPANDEQAMMMATSYLHAFREEWSKGGYIFVTSRQAPEILLHLSIKGIFHCAVTLPDTDSIEEVVAFDNPKLLWVFIEDDSLPHAVRAARFKVIQLALRKKFVKAFGQKIESKVQPIVAPNPAPPMRLMFIGLGLPTEKGFAIVLAQMRSFGMGACFIHADNSHDRLVNQLLGIAVPSNEELQALNANTIRVFGSGLKHSLEIQKVIGEYQGWEVAAANTQQGSAPTKDRTQINTDRLLKESNLGVAFGFGERVIVDLDN